MVGDRVVRLPNRPRIGVDHEREATNACIAASIGIGPDVVLSRDDGTLVTRTLDGESPTVATFPPLVEEAGRLLRRLHDGPDFAGTFDPFDLIERLRDDVGPSDCDALLAAVPHVDPRFDASCHVDTWPGNFICTSDGLRLVDWEYSAMADPMWDLADLSVEADLSAADDEQLLAAHGDADVDRFVALKPVCDLLWSLWSLAEHAAGNQADDFVAEAARRTARGFALLSG
jgi:hypothetical protein